MLIKNIIKLHSELLINILENFKIKLNHQLQTLFKTNLY